MKKYLIELPLLVVVCCLTMIGVCWGPPGPPSTPVGNAGIYTLSVIGLAAYGFWKSRK